MKNETLDSDALLSEKNLFSIYVAARKVRSSRFNLITTVIFFVAAVLQAVLSPQTVEAKVEFVRKYADFGFNAALTTMGFLVAGFTIFATLSDPELFIKMGQRLHPDSKISWLKHNFFLFIRVFIYFIVFIVWCLLVIVFGSKSGVVSYLIMLFDDAAVIREWVASAAQVLLITGFYFILMQLKSFVFNMHHAVMTSLKWKWDKADKADKGGEG
ncbi:hypothetical protein CMV24_06320 [Pseudomonas plecoglossicida]|uniref:Uncharacterized protein n=2 Tax=Pseudomonas putida group TaxID=136845 RepID=A0A2A3M881_PSEDL|nr:MULTISPECIES: hypothetical protein [Pseudomonas]EGC00797.1 hypothetical protein G1E_01061 [Pseudomonas sp. TJI-51]MBF8700106.1 hypothetical protein [Pseudomonas putida]MBF8734696.1 hypothetical protein [Pseudomonas putida]MBF8766109.1 hypothetical protein [Pseudomonas putida]MBN4165650.1 hypothetical protein [Pseudomonas fulva]